MIDDVRVQMTMEVMAELDERMGRVEEQDRVAVVESYFIAILATTGAACGTDGVDAANFIFAEVSKRIRAQILTPQGGVH